VSQELGPVTVVPHKYLDTSVNEVVGKRTDVTQSSKSLSSERLEFKLTLSMKMVDCVLYVKGENSVVKHFSVPQTEEDGNVVDKELLPGDIKYNFVILDAEVYILQETDYVLSGLLKDSAVKSLSLSHIEQGNKNIDKEMLLGDIKDNFVILNAEVGVMRDY
jgi:hypothetical protein